MIDTDSDPDMVDIPIPANDDAMRAIELIVAAMADAIEEGKRARPEDKVEEGQGAAPGGSRGGRGRRSSRATARASEAPAAPADEGRSPESAGAEAAEYPPAGTAMAPA